MAAGGTAGNGGQDDEWGWSQEGTSWVAPEIDTTRPSSARIYDYALGGKDNFAVDRDAFAAMTQSFPDYPDLAKANRGFLIRAVGFMADAGIDQFIDLGTGIPTSPNVHEVAQKVRPHAKVVYVDNDPIVMAHNRARRASWPGVITVQHDIREPGTVLEDDAVKQFIDFDRPIGLLMLAVLHFVSKNLTAPILNRFRASMAPGSYFAASVGTSEGLDLTMLDEAEDVTQRAAMPFTLRTRAQIEQIFDGFDLVEPGLVDITQWRNDGKPLSISNLAGVGLKR
jgi:hypothetical protein